MMAENNTISFFQDILYTILGIYLQSKKQFLDTSCLKFFRATILLDPIHFRIIFKFLRLSLRLFDTRPLNIQNYFQVSLVSKMRVIWSFVTQLSPNKTHASHSYFLNTLFKNFHTFIVAFHHLPFCIVILYSFLCLPLV